MVAPHYTIAAIKCKEYTIRFFSENSIESLIKGLHAIEFVLTVSIKLNIFKSASSVP